MAKPLVRLIPGLRLYPRDRDYAQSVADMLNELGDDAALHGTGGNAQGITNGVVRRRWMDYANKDGKRLEAIYSEARS